jgi:hypothetical protein
MSDSRLRSNTEIPIDATGVTTDFFLHKKATRKSFAGGHRND